MLTVEEIIDYFKLENSHAKKELGQNFLINKNVIDQIVTFANLKKEDNLLEIGPGLGSLTNELIGKTDKFTVVEYDAKFVKFLELSYGKENIIIEKNNIIKHKNFSYNKVVGNLPYYMTTEIIEFVTTKYFSLEKAVFMVQKECYQRLISLNGKDVNALNIFLNYMFNIKNELIVGKNNFFPAPSVDSLVFSLTKKVKSNLEYGLKLLKVANILFLNRRKTIYNNLNNLVKDKEKSREIILKSNLKENNRAEELQFNDFLQLTNILIENKIIK